MATSPAAAQLLQSNAIQAHRDVNITTTSVNHSHNISARRDPMEILQENVAFGALHDSAERFDPPRCHPQTRTAILNHIDGWARDRSASAKPVLWLSGPAGAGKSAIVQTMIEQWKIDELFSASFFFRRAATNQNHKTYVVSTFAFQLGLLYPPLKLIIERIVSETAVLRKTLWTQLEELIVNPVSTLPEGEHPIIFVIDGLDECCVNLPGRDHEPGQDFEAQQKEILDAVALACQKDRGVRLRFLIVRRPERQIRDSFSARTLEAQTLPISLKGTADANADIRLFLECRFEEIRKCWGIPPPWPSHDQLSELVRKSSGQFIYPSLAVKYASRPRANPIQSLEAVLALQPGLLDHPLTELDALYTLVLDSVSSESLPIVNTMFSYLTPSPGPSVYPIFLPRAPVCSLSFFDKFLLLSKGEMYTHLTDLHSVLYIPSPSSEASISFVHATFSEYLEDESRSGRFFVPEDDVFRRQIPLFLRHLENWNAQLDGTLPYDEEELFRCFTRYFSIKCVTSRSLMDGLWYLMEAEVGPYPNVPVNTTSGPPGKEGLSRRFIDYCNHTTQFKTTPRQILAYLQECNIYEVEPSWWRRYLVRRRLEIAISRRKGDETPKGAVSNMDIAIEDFRSCASALGRQHNLVETWFQHLMPHSFWLRLLSYFTLDFNN